MTIIIGEAEKRLSAVIDQLQAAIVDYAKPACAVSRLAQSDGSPQRFTALMRWGVFDAVADVTDVVQEALDTGSLSAEGGFVPSIDGLIYALAKAIVERHEKLDLANHKRAMRSAKVLRIVEE